ncbi:MAG: hypothetical protein H6838_09365 [Planctomycetes bacterium]|nr:hypothetical protein [Planctomycetota bacterium]MCB9885689.1 hypothetical protein [Planctomycetota bacterium]
MVQPLLRFLGLHDATSDERRATLWVSVMFFCALSSTFLLRPLRDQFGVHQGVEELPALYSLTLLATVVAVLPFWWLANRMPSRRFVPIVLHLCAAAFVLLALGLNVIGDYDWSRLPWLGGVFWGGFSAVNVIVPTMVWIHAVEHFHRDQARRLFGLVAVGGTLGAVFGSWASSFLTGTAHAPLWLSGAAAAALLEFAFLAFALSRPACVRMKEAGEPGGAAAPQAATGGVLEGFRVLLRDGYAQRIGVYMMLLGVLATSFYAAQTELVGEQIKAGKAQHQWLASAEFWGQGLVLVLQLFWTGRLMKRLPGAVLLVSLPVVSVLGLGIWWLAPTAAAIFFVQIGRRGTQYAFEKPAREVLYTPLSLETKHKVKFLLDTFAFRLGDLLGAVLQLQLRDWKLTTGGIVLVTIGVAVVWIALGLSLGRRRAWQRTS